MSGDGVPVAGPHAVAAMNSGPAGEPGAKPSNPNDGMASKALRGGLVLLITRLAMQGFTWASTLLVVRLLDPSDYGLMAATLFVLGLPNIIAEGGLSRALIQKAELSEHDKASAFTAGAVMSSAFFVLVWFAAEPLARYFDNPQFVVLLRFMALSLMIPIFFIVPIAHLERKLQYGAIAAASAISVSSQAAITLLLAWQGWGVWALAIGILTSKLTYAVYIFWSAPWTPRLTRPDAAGMKILTFGMTIAATNLLWYLNHNADTGVILGLIGPAQLGLYAVAMQLATIPLEKLSVTVNNISFATFSRLQNDPEKLRRWFLKLLTLRAIATFPMLIGLALVAEDALPVMLGEKWRPLIPLFQVLAPVGGLMVINTAFSPLFNATGRADLAFKMTAVSLVVLTIGFYVGCRAAGIMGVCMAWAVLYPILFLGMVAFTGPASGIGLGAVLKALSAPTLATVMMTLAVLTVRLELIPEDAILLRLFASVLVGVVSFALVIALVDGRTLWNDAVNLRALLKGGKTEDPAP